ncbi:MAG: type II toxin-antitoxin system RelE/ParE family toxin [Pseudomonadales bacterium]
MQGSYTKSKKTDQDIKHITKQSISDFGERQTDKYLNGLEESLQLLADKPKLGRVLTHGNLTKKEYHCHRYVSHVIYYRQRKRDIFIVRILHKKMLPEKHL